MRRRQASNLLPAVTASLLLAGIFAPAAVLGQLGASNQTQGQLSTLVGVAQSSRAYASSTIDLAVSHGLNVSAAQAQLAEGDSFLATAQADAQSGSDISAGILAAQAAMRDYTYAAASASVALKDAGLTVSVDYAAAAGAVAEVNATASVVASVAAQVCAGAGTGASNSTALVQACAQVEANIAAATAHLKQAASLLVQASGSTTVGANYSQALSLIAEARAEVNATQSSLVTIASYTYSARGQAYVTAIIEPLSAKANATIAAEQSVLAGLNQFWLSFDAYSSSQTSAQASVTSSVSTLATAILQVNTGAVSSNISASETTAAAVKADMWALLNISAIDLLPVASSIQASITATTSYQSSLATADSQSGAYAQTQLSSFSGYLSTMTSSQTDVQTKGAAYLSAYQTVVTDLSALTSITGVQAILDSLTSLQVSATVDGVNTALQQETAAMGTVQTDISSMDSVAASSSSAILVGSGLVSNITTLSAQAQAYLNATASAALSRTAAQVQVTAQTAASLVAAVNAATQATIGTFAASAATISGTSSTLSAETSASLTSTSNAIAYVHSDTQARISEAASGQADVSQALQLFSSLDVSGGATAMAQASLELQAASAVNATT